MTETLGIFQSDILIRGAIEEGLARLRAEPGLLDSVFRSLTEDPITKDIYGAKTIEAGKGWFLKTNIPVSMSYRFDEAKFPCISISLQQSIEAESTLGDVHYLPSEETEGDWPALAGPFNPVAYTASSGMMVLPSTIVADLVLAPGMWILDRTGQAHEVLEVLDDNIIGLTPFTVADFSNAILKGAKPRFVTSLESLNFKETYQIGCHVQGESEYLMYLHSIVMFALLRYKEELLEARGFERSVMSSSDFRQNEAFAPELVYSRSIVLTGYVKHYWPKYTGPRPEVVKSLVVYGLPGTNGDPTSDGPTITGDEPWLVDEDALSTFVLPVEVDEDE